MANRRMFSLDVVDTDRFLDMPATTQNLYFHLGMRADDDGFVSSPKKITKLVNCGTDDLNVLVSRGYVIPMGDGLVVIRHWTQNNYIQKDRYKPTIYQKEKNLLSVSDGVYSLDTECIQNVSELYPQDRLGKDRIDKDSKPISAQARRGSVNLDNLLPEYDFSQTVADALRSWVTYKKERHEQYKPQGMKSLLSQVKKQVSDYGDAAVIDVIEVSMSNGWKGICWSKLEKQEKTDERRSAYGQGAGSISF